MRGKLIGSLSAVAALLALAPAAGATKYFTTPVKLAGGPAGGEPSIATDPFGDVFVAGPQGIPSGANGKSGTGFWASRNDGSSFANGQYIGSYLGGGDRDLQEHRPRQDVHRDRPGPGPEQLHHDQRRPGGTLRRQAMADRRSQGHPVPDLPRVRQRPAARVPQRQRGRRRVLQRVRFDRQRPEHRAERPQRRHRRHAGRAAGHRQGREPLRPVRDHHPAAERRGDAGRPGERDLQPAVPGRLARPLPIVHRLHGVRRLAGRHQHGPVR